MTGWRGDNRSAFRSTPLLSSNGSMEKVFDTEVEVLRGTSVQKGCLFFRILGRRRRWTFRPKFFSALSPDRTRTFSCARGRW